MKNWNVQSKVVIKNSLFVISYNIKIKVENVFLIDMTKKINVNHCFDMLSRANRQCEFHLIHTFK